MLVFACSIIATSQCWLFAFRANTEGKYPRIQLPVSAQWSERLAYIYFAVKVQKKKYSRNLYIIESATDWSDAITISPNLHLNHIIYPRLIGIELIDTNAYCTVYNYFLFLYQDYCPPIMNILCRNII